MVELRIEDKELLKRLEELGDRAKDGRPVFTPFYSDWHAIVGKEWGQVRSGGGNFRGVRWAGFKPQYIRKDGTVVPAWGGVPRVQKGWTQIGNQIRWEDGQARRGRQIMRRNTRRGGTVKGKLRPSGQRVKANDTIMQDTGHLRQKTLTDAPFMTESTLRIGGTDLPVYAERQFIDYGRNPLFFTAEDAKRFEQRGREYIEELTRKFNK